MLHPKLELALQAVSRRIFGTLPHSTVATGYRGLRSEDMWRMARITEDLRLFDPRQRIERIMHKGLPGIVTEDEIERLERIGRMQMKGKGAPKKGAGKRKTKKG